MHACMYHHTPTSLVLLTLVPILYLLYAYEYKLATLVVCIHIRSTCVYSLEYMLRFFFLYAKINKILVIIILREYASYYRNAS